MHNILTTLKYTEGNVTVKDRVATFPDGTTISLNNHQANFPIERWEPNPDKSGFLRRAKQPTFKELEEAIQLLMKSQNFPYEWTVNGNPTSEGCEIPPFRELLIAPTLTGEMPLIQILGINGKNHFSIATIKTPAPLADCYLFSYQLFCYLYE